MQDSQDEVFKFKIATGKDATATAECRSSCTGVWAAETFKRTDSDYLEAENGSNRDAGSTASTAVLLGKQLLVANVGDSRAVISRNGQGEASRSHVKM